MSFYTMYPVVTDVDELEHAVEIQYDIKIDDIRNLLFGDDYHNDSYKVFDLEDEYDDEAELVKTYLKDIFPDYSCVLVNVSW